MPKPKVSDEEKLQAQMLEVLRGAIHGTPQRLQGTPKAPGLFPGGQAGTKLIQRARAEGLLEEVTTPEQPAGGKGKAKPPIYVVLTDRGRQFVLDQDNPVKLLAGLSERLDAQGAALAASVQDVRTQLSVFRQAIDQLETGLLTKFAHYQQVAQAFGSALDRLSQRPAHSPQPQVTPSSAIPPVGWLEEVMPFVAAQKRLNSFDRPTLKRLYEHLRQTHPSLTLGEFHEGLRTLHQQRRIRLDPFTQALATLQDSLHALYLDREVKYYVDLP